MYFIILTRGFENYRDYCNSIRALSIKQFSDVWILVNSGILNYGVVIIMAADNDLSQKLKEVCGGSV